MSTSPSRKPHAPTSSGHFSDQQDSVFQFVAELLARDGTNVRRYDTHAAVVFLAGDRALKIKRAVRFPFLDYSTLARRKAACTAEIDVNRRFAPQLYRGIVPIVRRDDGTLAIGGKGEPVEWAVDMKRFEDNLTLDRLADRGALPADMAGKLAAMVAAMHRAAGPVNAGPWISGIESYVTQNAQAFRGDPGLFPADDADRLERNSHAALQRLRPLLLARGDDGLIRRGHGDLHLGNIALIDGEPVAFDAIEFDPVIASGDVLYDLAFLLMDLVERDRVADANTILNGYFSGTQRLADYDGLAALPLFMSLRSAIRAKVTAAREPRDDDERNELHRLAQRYFRLACDLIEPARPCVVGVGGLSGTGKSVLARSLAVEFSPLPGALVLRSDVERETMFGVGETEQLPADAYRPEVSDKLYATLNEKAARIAKAGHSAIVDAVFAKPDERADLAKAAHQANADFLGLFLQADLSTRFERVTGRKGDASDADAAVVRQQQDYDLGSMDWHIVDASGAATQTLDKAKTLIR